VPSFILRRIDPEFWARVKHKAALEGRTVKTLIYDLLHAWLTPPKQQSVSHRLLRSREVTRHVVARELLYAGILARIWPAFLTEPTVPQVNFPALLCIESPAGLLVWRLSADELAGFQDWIPYRDNPGTPAEDKFAALYALAMEGWETIERVYEFEVPE
jgi:hypothetical protein